MPILIWTRAGRGNLVFDVLDGEEISTDSSVHVSQKLVHTLIYTHKMIFMFRRSGSSWLKVTPFAIRKQLKWIKDRYNNVPVYVTENGVSDRNGSLVDIHRINYYRAYINEVLKGIWRFSTV